MLTFEPHPARYPLNLRAVVVLLTLGVAAGIGAETGPAGEPGSSGAAGVPQRSGMPSRTEITKLLHSTLDTIDYANKTGSYIGVYALLTPEVQKKVDLPKLAQVLAGFRQLELDLAPIQRMKPSFERPPQLSEDGVLTLRGSFPMEPRVVRFDLGYRKVDNLWRIEALNLDTPPVPGATAAAGPGTVENPTPVQQLNSLPPAEAQTPPAAVPAVAAPAAPTPAAPPPPQATPGRPPVVNSPYLDTSTDPPTTSKW